MTWQTVDKILENMGSGGSDYIKIPPGGTIRGVFVGEPACFYKKFQDRVESPVFIEGANFRFRTNFALLQDNGTFTMKILEGGKKTLKIVAAVIKKYGTAVIFEINREGKGKEDTVYHVLFDRKLNGKEEEELSKLEQFKVAIRNSESTESVTKEIMVTEVPKAKTTLNSEQEELRAQIIDKLMGLFGTSGKDLEDAIEMFSEFRIGGRLEVKGVRNIGDLKFHINPGKKMSQANMFYIKLKNLDSEQAAELLVNWRKGIYE